MRGTMPVLHCDGDDGCCSEWVRDFYATDVAAVGHVTITSVARAPGWITVVGQRGTFDFCPFHTTLREPS